MATPTDMLNQVRAFGQTLARTEWLPPQQLQAHRAPLIAQLLRHARETTSYYRTRLDVDLHSHQSISASWSKIPILTRAELMRAGSKMTTRAHPPNLGSIAKGETSGSTGMPVAFKKSEFSIIPSLALTERLYRWWSIDGASSLALIAPDRGNTARPPDGLTTSTWHSNHPNGVRHFIGLETDTDTHLDWLVARRPRYLGTYPAILKELARAALRRQIELKFSVLFSFATVLDDETRELCRTAFGAEIADTYGTQEADHIACQCPKCGEYHISAETTVVEVLRADGVPAAPGEIGRVIVTPLYNYAMPLIRYELGDMAEVGTAPPACGLGLPTLRRILGRYRNMFTYRDGSTSWPVSARFKLAEFIALKQFQVVQTDFDTIEIRYVPADKAAKHAVDLAALTNCVRMVLRQPVNVTIRSVDEIARSRSGKFEDCISLVSSGATGPAPTLPSS